jgi:GNAT superfamily N-acetyltransferase
VRPTDEAELLRFLRSLSEDSRISRFFSLSTDLAREARREIELDYTHTFGLLATAGAPPRVVAHALYSRFGADRAEVALEVADEYQGRGLGTILIGQLAERLARVEVVTPAARAPAAHHHTASALLQPGQVCRAAPWTPGHAGGWPR